MKNTLRLPAFFFSLSLLLFSCSTEEDIGNLEAEKQISEVVIDSDFGAFTKEIKLTSEDGLNSMTILIGSDSETHLAQYSERSFGLGLLKKGESINTLQDANEIPLENNDKINTDVAASTSVLSIMELSREQADDVLMISLNVLPLEATNGRVNATLQTTVLYSNIPSLINLVAIWKNYYPYTPHLSNLVRYKMHWKTSAGAPYQPVVTAYGPNNDTCNEIWDFGYYHTLNYSNTVDGISHNNITAMAHMDEYNVHTIRLTVQHYNSSYFSHSFYWGDEWFQEYSVNIIPTQFGGCNDW